MKAKIQQRFFTEEELKGSPEYNQWVGGNVALIHNTLTAPYNKGAGNQEILEENRKHFQGQAQKVLEHLQKGERVSSLRMMQLHGIIDTRARIYSLKKAGHKIGEQKLKGGFKEWFLIVE